MNLKTIYLCIDQLIVTIEYVLIYLLLEKQITFLRFRLYTKIILINMLDNILIYASTLEKYFIIL